MKEMTGVKSRLKYGKAVQQYDGVKDAMAGLRKPIRVEIDVKCAYEKAQLRLVSVSGRFVRTATALMKPMRVLVNDQLLHTIESSPETCKQATIDVATVLLQYLEDNRESNLSIVGEVVVE